MPLYEYQCPNDGTFEKMQKFSDPPLTHCPKCGAKVEKLLSAPAIQFKGTGWYVTDYARKSGGEREKASSSEKRESTPAKGSSADAGSSSGGGSSEKKSSGPDKK